MESIKQVEQRLSAIASELERLYDEIARLEDEAGELEEAKLILVKHFGKHKEGTSPLDEVLSGLSKMQRPVYLAVPIGKAQAKKPIDVVNSCSKLDPAYVRTTLWRFAEYGTISSEDGLYWRDHPK